LIRLAPNQPLLLIDGVERKAAFFVRSAVSGMVDTALDGSTRLSVSGRLDVRRSPGTDTFGFGVASADLMWRGTAPALSWGIGPSLQRTWVSGTPLRDTASLQADLLWGASPSGHWAAFASAGHYRHPLVMQEFDSHAISASLQRRWNTPAQWLSGIEIEGGWMIERNARHLAAAASTFGQRPNAAGVISRAWLLSIGSGRASRRQVWMATRPGETAICRLCPGVV
jgi:hypothetical protein